MCLDHLSLLSIVTTNNLEYVVNFMRWWPILKLLRGPIINNNNKNDVKIGIFSYWSGFGIIKKNRENPSRSGCRSCSSFHLFSGGIQIILETTAARQAAPPSSWLGASREVKAVGMGGIGESVGFPGHSRVR